MPPRRQVIRQSNKILIVQLPDGTRLGGDGIVCGRSASPSPWLREAPDTVFDRHLRIWQELQIVSSVTEAALSFNMVTPTCQSHRVIEGQYRRDRVKSESEIPAKLWLSPEASKGQAIILLPLKQSTGFQRLSYGDRVLLGSVNANSTEAKFPSHIVVEMELSFETTTEIMVILRFIACKIELQKQPAKVTVTKRK